MALLALQPGAGCGLFLGGSTTLTPGADGAAGDPDGGGGPAEGEGDGEGAGSLDGGRAVDLGGSADLGPAQPTDTGAPDGLPDLTPDGGSPPADAGDPGEQPWVRLTAPQDGEQVPNPVAFQFQAGGGVEQVRFYAENDWPMHADPLPADAAVFTYSFAGVGRERVITLAGFVAGQRVASDELRFTPLATPQPPEGQVGDQPGFNHYVVAAVNDVQRYPRDGSHRYCWGQDWCGAGWGQIYGSSYVGRPLFDGGGDCFCSGYTLEIFFDAYGRWQTDQGVPVATAYGGLGWDDAHGGIFYQWWQGYDNQPGSAPDINVSSAAQAFAWAGIGEDISGNRDAAIAGDFVNLSRDTGSGHSVIFVDWVRDGGQIVGLRYYGCNGNNSAGGGGGDSRPDPNDPQNSSPNSGPSFQTEYLVGHGGHVMPEYLFLGHPTDPAAL